MEKLPEIEACGPYLVVRDDRFKGGTKARVLPEILAALAAPEFVYASPVYGYAQIALAHAARAIGARATVFVAKRRILHERTARAKAAGAKIVGVPFGYLSNVQSKATAYAAAAGAYLLPFGFDLPAMETAIAQLAASLPVQPEEVWTVAGSGLLSRALQQAWPAARFYAVQIGAPPRAGRATVIRAPEQFEQPARQPPPFASCNNYDAKAWQFIKKRAAPGALFWNVAA